MKVHLSALGCKLNQNEIETIARQLAAAGHQVVLDPADADTIIVNTCTVTHVAARKSRQLARRLHRANSSARLVLTGCFAEISREEAAKLPGVSRVVGNQEKDRLIKLLGLAPDESLVSHPDASGITPQLRTRASVKIQDGCDNECTYCIVRIARGAQRSRAKDEIMAEIRARLHAGYQEIVLTGVHIGAYGRDQQQITQTSLWELVEEILANTAVPRLRLSSIEPWDIAGENLRLWEDKRLCRHLHLPLQSGSNAVLGRMRRHYTSATFAGLVEHARRIVPEIAITTDVIVGFPGETEAEFAETLRFVEAMHFRKVHIFPFSSREGTEAAGFSPQLAPQVKQDRVQRLAQIAKRNEMIYCEQFVNRTVEVLWETQTGAAEWSGLTDHYVRVHAHHPIDIRNTITPVYISALSSTGLCGHIL